ncbi:MAG TPA: diguanylate cyclase [Actinoplanes sp.]|nr:diguanylate cyclase [Actinoplanes sp.]
MTLRGRLTTAFLAVVLGPVLLGSLFVGITVSTVTRDRTTDRLDHAATTVRTAISAVCRQLQAIADTVAGLPADDRAAAADRLVRRGLVSTMATGGNPGWRNCDGRTGGGVAALAAGTGDVVAVQNLDAGFLERLAASSGADVLLAQPERDQRVDADSTTGSADDRPTATRRVPIGPGQPLPLVVSVPAGTPLGLYVLLIAAVVLAGTAAVLVARWLARSTTRPLAELAHAADLVAGGDLGTRVPVGRDDEMGRLATAFNRMTRELQAYVQAMTASRDQLRGHLAILGDTLSSTHDLHRILQVILQTALAATSARAGVVLLLDPVDDRLVARCAEGLPEQDLPTLRVPLGAGMLGAVAATGQARRGRRKPGGATPGEPPGRTYVAVPICAPVAPDDAEPAQQTLGVLALYDRLGAEEFDDTDLRTLRTFAGQAGVAVHNVRAHEEAQRLSLTDPLTGLWNYRYLRESLRREVERASRFGRMLTVLVLDLDHFKDVNDRYGHAAGDAVLGEFARRLRAGLREVDVAFRQGGEEFVVLLPETDAYGGAIVAERLGAAIRDIPVPIEARRLDATGVVVDRIAVSVSIGVAVYPEHGVTAQDVLDAADDALYAAKRAGRDTYRLAEVVSPVVPDGHFDEAHAAPGGPHPPRQSRGR